MAAAVAPEFSAAQFEDDECARSDNSGASVFFFSPSVGCGDRSLAGCEGGIYVFRDDEAIKV